MDEYDGPTEEDVVEWSVQEHSDNYSENVCECSFALTRGYVAAQFSSPGGSIGVVVRVVWWWWAWCSRCLFHDVC